MKEEKNNEFIERQINGCHLVCECLELNKFSPRESMAICWNVFANLFRQHYDQPTYEKFSEVLSAFLREAKEKWPHDP